MTATVHSIAPSADPIAMPLADLLELAKPLAAHASKDPTRSHLAGICIDTDAMVATDGHRLLLIAGAGIGAIREPYVMPLWIIDAIKDAIASCAHSAAFTARLTYDPCGRLTVEVPEIALSIGTLTPPHPFPPYRRVIPSDCQRTATVKRRNLARFANAAIKHRYPATESALTFAAGALSYHDRSEPDSEPLSCEIACDGELTIGVQPRYLLDAVRAMTGDIVAIESSDALSPIVMRSDNRTCVIMPCRL